MPFQQPFGGICVALQTGKAICSLIYCVRDLLIQSTGESVLYAGLGPPASYALVSKISLPVSVYGPRA